MPDLYVPATAEKKMERDRLRAVNDERVEYGPDGILRPVADTRGPDTNVEPETPRRAARSVVRGARMGNGMIPCTFEDGPLAGKTFGLKPGTKHVAMPVIMNANERATAHLAGLVVPEPDVSYIMYRKRPGFTDEGAQRFVRE